MKPDSLWVPDRIASALVEKGLGGEVVRCLVRETAVPKSAWSDASERPTPSRHFETIAVQGRIADPPPEKFVLIDDLVTRGATSLGAANRLLEVFPKAQVRAFAAMRTISVPSEFTNMYDPQVGTIEYRAWIDDTLRRP
jgi:predicted amidophosphoribosyltransferase